MRFAVILFAVSLLCFLTACLTDEERDRILSKISSDTASRAALSRAASSESSLGDGVTQYEPGVPPYALHEYFGYETAEEFERAASSFTSSLAEDVERLRREIESQRSSIISGNKDRPDHELDVPDYWTSFPDYGNGGGSYPWENDSDIPSLKNGISEKPYDIQGDDGERGDTWTIPKAEIPRPDIDFPIPEMPNSDKMIEMESPED